MDIKCPTFVKFRENILSDILPQKTKIVSFIIYYSNWTKYKN